MDQPSPASFEFIDLSGVEEQERKWILSSLHTTNPNIELPWVDDDEEYIANHYEDHDDYANQADVLIPPSVSVNENHHGIPLHPTPMFAMPAYDIPPFVTQVYSAAPVVFVHHDVPPSPFIVNNFTTQNPNFVNSLQEEYVDDYPQTNGIPNDENHSEVEDASFELNNNVNGNKEEFEDEVAQEELSAPSEASVSEKSVILPSNKTWASLLFNNAKPREDEAITKEQFTNNQVKPRGVNNVRNNERSAQDGPYLLVPYLLKEPFKSNVDDPNLHRMGEFLIKYAIDNRIISLQPRGLINRSNYCYINSILQAILACPPVYNLLEGLAKHYAVAAQKKRITPIIDSMVKFVREFHHLPAGMRVTRRLSKTQKKDNQALINCGTPFEPHWMNKILNGVRSDTFVVEGRQEDAEEFFGFLINGLNDEMLELMKLVGMPSEPNHVGAPVQEEDKEWQVMGPKNKGCVTRRTEINRTPIIDIFGGLLRSRVHRAGDQPTDNIQPFFTLQLNIEKSGNVRDALDLLVCKNQLEGITSSKTNEEVEAWQQVTIEELPLVLVLHVKCFDYKPNGCSKIMKPLEFPIDLKIEPKMLSSKINYTAKERQYKLFAVVYHEGKEATKGHYVTDAYHVGYASWLRYDDASVKTVPEEHVLKPVGTRVPYLLLYRRSDSINKK